MATYSNIQSGDAVRSHWRSIHYLRSRSTKGTAHPTPLQLAVRARVALAAEALSPIKSILSMGFSEKNKKGVNYYNAAMKAFLSEAIVGDYPNLAVDYSKMQISMGSLGGLTDVTMEYSTVLTLNWFGQVNPYRFFGDDRVVVLIYNQTTRMYLVDEHASRLNSSVNIDIASTIGDVIHAWVFCIRRDHRKVSTSEYVGRVVLS